MPPVTASTNTDNPKIDFAGVDAGAKMFVGLEGWVGSAKANAAPPKHTNIREPSTRPLVEPRDRNLMPSVRLIAPILGIAVPSTMQGVGQNYGLRRDDGNSINYRESRGRHDSRLDASAGKNVHSPTRVILWSQRR